MAKGQSDRGVRTEESGVEENVPVTDATSGDEGIDDGFGGKPFIPGRPEKYAPEKSGPGSENAASHKPTQPSHGGPDPDKDSDRQWSPEQKEQVKTPIESDRFPAGIGEGGSDDSAFDDGSEKYDEEDAAPGEPNVGGRPENRG